jgi:hypothetical protein
MKESLGMMVWIRKLYARLISHHSKQDGTQLLPLSLNDLTQLHSEVNVMSKIVVAIGYKNYVLDTADAIKVAEALSKAELYDTKYRSQEKGGTSVYVWEQDERDSTIAMTILSDSLYRMAKLAGRPTKD